MKDIIICPIPLKDFEALARGCIKLKLQNHSVKLFAI
jgi:hypothetical protein